MGLAVPETETLDAGNATYSVTLPSFEGPLDLLLHLCQKHELNILEIPIGFVTEKYLEYLAMMQMAAGSLGLDLASEYLLMAATLAHIKSKMLLPAPPPGQEDEASELEEDPREALIRRLLEYQKYKQAAADLSARGVAGRDVFPRGVVLEEAVNQGLPPLAEVPLYSLLEAFQAVLDRAKVKISHDVVADRLSQSDRNSEIADVPAARKRITYHAHFEGATTKFDLVITFLALLEMSKLRMTRLFQTEPLAPIYVELAARDDDELPPAVAPDDAPPTATASDDAPPPAAASDEAPPPAAASDEAPPTATASDAPADGAETPPPAEETT